VIGNNNFLHQSHAIFLESDLIYGNFFLDIAPVLAAAIPSDDDRNDYLCHMDALI